MIKNIFNKIIDIILPQKCLKCSVVGEIICANCLPTLKRCQKYLGEDTFSIFSYEDSTVSEAIKMLKYKGITMVVPSLSRMIGETLLEHISEMEIMSASSENEEIIVIPVPLHQERFSKRGFNQSEVIARAFIKELQENKLKLEPNILKRIKNTDSQVSKMTRTKRLINLNNAFRVDNLEKIKGKVAILIDDVITTGATIAECRKTLEKAGARKVIAISLAH